MKKVVHITERELRGIITESIKKAYGLHRLSQLNESAEDVGNMVLDQKALAEVYKSNKQLQAIGTFDNYARYVSSIFPNSQLKNIAYHGSTCEMSSFESGHDNPGNDYSKGRYKAGFFFAEKREMAEFYMDKFMSFLRNLIHLRRVCKPTLYRVVLNIQNPAVLGTNGGRGIRIEQVNNAFDGGYDCLVVKNVYDPIVKGDVYVVFNSSQIHILGNNGDAALFSQYMKQNQFGGVTKPSDGEIV